jgi:hypothetical protein
MMADGAFLDPTRAPSRTALADALGDRLHLWDRLASWIEATYGVEPEPLFYGRDSGWVVRYRRSGKSLVTMLPMRHGMKVVVVVGPSVADQVPGLDLQPAVRRAYRSAHPYADGRWLNLAVEDPRDVDDITRLIALKSPPPRRPRRRTRVAA